MKPTSLSVEYDKKAAFKVGDKLPGWHFKTGLQYFLGLTDILLFGRVIIIENFSQTEIVSICRLEQNCYCKLCVYVVENLSVYWIHWKFVCVLNPNHTCFLCVIRVHCEGPDGGRSAHGQCQGVQPLPQAVEDGCHRVLWAPVQGKPLILYVCQGSH